GLRCSEDPPHPPLRGTFSHRFGGEGKNMALLTPRDAREEVDLGPLGDRLRPGIAEDLAVDRHRDAAIDEGLEPGIGFAKPGEQLADGGSLDLDRVAALGCRPQGTPERYAYSCALRLRPNHDRPSSAFRIRGGDIGMWVIRRPTAFDTALAIAASGGTIEVSP